MLQERDGRVAWGVAMVGREHREGDEVCDDASARTGFGSIYVTPVMPTAASTREEIRAYQVHIKKVELLWFLLAQATKGSAISVVQRYD